MGAGRKLGVVCTSVMSSSGCSKKILQLCPVGMSFSDQSLEETTPAQT